MLPSPCAPSPIPQHTTWEETPGVRSGYGLGQLKNDSWVTADVGHQRGNKEQEADWANSSSHNPHNSQSVLKYVRTLQRKEQPCGRPWWPRGEESSCQCGRHRFHPWLKKFPRAAGQLSMLAATIAHLPRARAPQQGKSARREAHTFTKTQRSPK